MYFYTGKSKYIHCPGYIGFECVFLSRFKEACFYCYCLFSNRASHIILIYKSWYSTWSSIWDNVWDCSFIQNVLRTKNISLTELQLVLDRLICLFLIFHTFSLVTEIILNAFERKGTTWLSLFSFSQKRFDIFGTEEEVIET